jgi:enterochelin esterase-like enzyme
VKAATLVVCAAALAVCAAAGMSAQGRGGRGAASPGTGTVERITVHGKALEGSPEAGSPNRQVTVYLPPGYAADQNRRYPVVYLLHDDDGRDDTLTAGPSGLQESADRLAAAQGFSAAIVVTPDASSSGKGSLDASPEWERFVAEDLVAHIDGRYRTLASRMSRGLAGHAAGGTGALRIGMKRPDVYLSLYAMSAASPPAGMLEQYASNLKTYYAIALDVGTSDPARPSNRQFHDAMTRLRVPHFYEEYDGDRVSRIRERIERNVLPFFSMNLVAPANPTSPLPPR